jgi:hypothetical protein
MKEQSEKTHRRRALSSTKVARGLGLVVKLGRATAFCVVVLVAGLFLGARTVRGQIGEKALKFGQDLAEFADVLRGTHRVMLNGETIYLSSAVSDQDKHILLERFAAHCEKYSGGLGEEFAKVPEAKQEELAKHVPILWGMRFGMVHTENETDGMVACIAQQESGGALGTLERLTRVLETGDLARFGNLRYAFVRRLPNGKSHVLTTFTEGSFNLNRVLGLDGEAGGSDPPDVPRPPGSRRVLSVSADGAPYGVQSFHTGASPDAITKYYDDVMPKLGWTKALDDPNVYNAAVYHRGGILMTMTALQLEEGTTAVTFLEGSQRNPVPSFQARVE